MLQDQRWGSRSAAFAKLVRTSATDVAVPFR